MLVKVNCPFIKCKFNVGGLCNKSEIILKGIINGSLECFSASEE